MKLKPIYNESTNDIIFSYIMYMEENEVNSQVTIDSLDIAHFIGKIQHQIKEIERLNNIINKAIEYIYNNYPVCAGKELLEILGDDNV